MLIAALFTIARTLKQPRCSLTDVIEEWIKKLYIYTMETTQPCKGTVLMRWMNLEPIIQNEVSQKKENKYHVWMYIYMESRECPRWC